VFDSFGYHRSDLLFNLEQIQAYGSKLQKERANGQVSMFSLMGDDAVIPEPKIEPAPARAPEKEQLFWERDLMGLYLSAHPLDKFDTYFNEQTHPYSYVSKQNVDHKIILGGIVTNEKMVLTKAKQEKMAIVTMESKTGTVEFPVFPKLYKENADDIVVDAILRVTGVVDDRNMEGQHTEDVKFLPKEIMSIRDENLSKYQSTGEKLPEPEEVKHRTSKRKPVEEKPKEEEKPKIAPRIVGVNPRDHKLYILIEDPENTDKLTAIKSACDLHPGLSPVVLVLKDGGEKKAMVMSFRVEASDELMQKIKDIVGEKAVVLK
jgi:DNA polymerase-3 subunit alpha